MTKRRKILSVFLMLVLSVTLFAVSASAINAENKNVFTLGDGEDAVEYDLDDGDSALEYVGNYADNLEADEGFESHVATAIAKVRESIPEFNDLPYDMMGPKKS